MYVPKITNVVGSSHCNNNQAYFFGSPCIILHNIDA